MSGQAEGFDVPPQQGEGVGFVRCRAIRSLIPRIVAVSSERIAFLSDDCASTWV